MSVGASRSSGKSSGTQTSEAATQLQEMAKGLLGEQSSLRQQFIGTLTNLLSGKGATPYTELDPSGAIEASKYAGAKALRTSEKDLGRKGLLGTPFGEGILANQRAETAFQTSQIAPSYKNESLNRAQQSYQAVLNLVPQFLTGTLGALTSGLTGAVQGNVSASGGSSGSAAGFNATPFSK